MNSVFKLIAITFLVSTPIASLAKPAVSQVKVSPNPVIAQGYYDSCPKAEPVHIYETKNYWVSICKDMNGSLFYHGVNKRDRDLVINLPDVLVVNQQTYRARNLEAKTFYDVSPRTLVVTRNGRVILREAVLRVH